MSKNFPSKILKRTDHLTKQCGRCNNYIDDSHSLCDDCLIAKYADGIPEGSYSEYKYDVYGYTSEQVAVLLRRALGEKPVFLSRAHEKDVTK